VTIYSSYTGYFGLALGVTAMDGADLLITYKTAAEAAPACNSFSARRHSVSLNPTPVWTKSPPLKSPQAAPIWASLVVSCKRPNVAAQTLTATANIDFIASWSSRPVTGPDSLRTHDDYISQNGGLLAAVADPSTGNGGKDEIPMVAVAPVTAILSNMSSDTVNMIHGILMTFAWCVAPYIGVFIARYLKDVLGVWWYRLHVALMLGGSGMVSVAALVLKILYTKPPHFTTLHQRMGLALEAALVLQIVLGFVSNALWKPTRTTIPWWDQLHWWLGRVCLGLGVVVVSLGFPEYNHATSGEPISMLLVVLFWTWIGLFLVAMLAGQFVFGQVHHLAAVPHDDDAAAAGDMGLAGFGKGGHDQQQHAGSANSFLRDNSYYAGSYAGGDGYDNRYNNYDNGNSSFSDNHYRDNETGRKW
jgi:hypothetical protein